MVNPLGVVVPMVGGKHAPLSAVASHFPFMISIIILCVYILDAMMECLCLWLSISVFEQLLEMLIFLSKLFYLYDL
jgi:hypothetical protein